MAKKGLYLKSIGSPFAYFEKGESINMRYRIDVLEKEPEEEQLEIYRLAGWEYVCHQKEFYVFCSPVTSNAPEIHTDPVEQAFTLIKANKQMKLSLFITVLLFFVSIISFYIYLQREKYLVLSLIKGELVQLLVILIFLSINLVDSLRRYFSLSMLKKNLSLGIPLNHHLNSRLHRFWIVIPFITVCAYLFFIVTVAFSKGYKSYPLPQINDASIPAVRLATLENTSSLQPYEKYRYNNNTVLKDSSFLLDAHYVISESRIANDRTWLNQNSSYTPSINTIFYQLRFQSLSKPLAKDLSRNYSDIYNYNLNQIKEIADTRFDILCYVEPAGENIQILAAALNHSTIFIYYKGEAKLELLINETAELLESYSSAD
jgi:hypothetical protein